MANAIALFKKYIDALDEVYKLESTTSDLESNAALTRAGAVANEILIPKYQLQGLADYDRNNGYVRGSIVLDYETVKYNFDRGRSFLVDAMDNEETAGIAFGSLAAEFLRTQVIPEMDAFRYASYAAKAGTIATPATIADGAALLTALLDATKILDEAEVPATERYLKITPTLLNAVMALDTTKSREVLNTFVKVTKVPQVRFYTAIDQLDGVTEGEEAGGFIKNAAGKDINFMIIHKPALLQFTKHTVTKVTRPEDNKDADAWQFNYRSYGLADVYVSKVKGIYLHNKA
ncbi:MAG: hypothetical protein ABFD29_10510 [Anaerolineaceae bacterium]